MLDWFTHPVMLLMFGGGIGTNARYWLGLAIRQIQGDVKFPWATFLINVSGSALLGAFAVLYLHHPDGPRKNWYLLLGTGFCGGFTTFSTFSYETLQLIQEDKPWAAAAYSLGSVACGLLAVWLIVKWMK